MNLFVVHLKNLLVVISSVYLKFKETYSEGYNSRKVFYVDVFGRHYDLKDITNLEDMQMYLKMLNAYLESLYHLNECDLLISEFNFSISLIQERLFFFDSDLKENVWYKDLYFLRGMALFKLKKYLASLQVFIKLTRFDKTREMYFAWRRYVLTFIVRSFLQNVQLVCKVGLILTFLLMPKGPYLMTRKILAIVFLATLILSGIILYYLNQKSAKSNL